MSKIYAWASVKNTWEGRPSIYFRLPGTSPRKHPRTSKNHPRASKNIQEPSRKQELEHKHHSTSSALTPCSF